MAEHAAPPTVVAAFRLEYHDMARAQWWHIFHLRALQLMYGLFFFSFFSVGLPAILKERTVDPRFLGFTFVFFVLLPVSFWRQIRKSYRALKPEQLDRRYTFDSRGFTIADGLSKAEVAWAAVPRAVETKDAILLFVQKQIFHVVPKRALATSEDETRLRAILREALGKNAQVRAAG